MSISSRGRLVRVLLAGTASIALVVSAGAAYASAQWWNLRTVGVDEGQFDATLPSMPTGATTSPIPDLPTGDCSQSPCNYLLLGSDSRSGLSKDEQQQFGTNQDIGGSNRADTIMLVHTDPALQKAIVLSFPRDLWVDIPGHGSNKINAAFEGGIEHGGAQLMAQTVSNLTGLRIDHYLYVDLAGFQKVVDTLGGVNLCVPAYNADPTTGRLQDPLTGLDIAPGCQRLQGAQALAYVRTRHLRCDANAPDFYRIQRQQQFLSAVIHQMLKPENLLRAPGLVQPVLGSMHRDKAFLPGDLVFLIGQLRGLAGGEAANLVEFRVVPGTVGWEGALSVVHMDPSAQQIFSAIRGGKPISGVGTRLLNVPPSEPNVTVAVVDRGAGETAQQVESLLAESGFDVTPGIWDAAKAPAGVSGAAAIVFRPGQDAAASVVSRYLPGVKVVESKSLKGVPVAVVLTPAYTYAEPGQGPSTPSTSDCPSA
jgi:LCP family protein required for cell wall assembly